MTKAGAVRGPRHLPTQKTSRAMMTASVSSFLLRVKSSASRTRCTSSGCTHTSCAPSAAASWSRTRHRCPVGSQATTTDS